MTLLNVPSGRQFDGLDLEIMRYSAETRFIEWFDEQKKLASGKRSHVYVKGRQDATENPGFLRLACRKILSDTCDLMDHADRRQPRFIGIPHVAHGWTPAISMVDAFEHITRRSACHAIMRSELKEHGAHTKWVAATHNIAQFRDILFDNVVTDSGSKETALKHMVEDGFVPSEIDAMVFVDRQQGGLENMKKLGFRSVHANYLLLDMTFAFQHLGLWPPGAAEKVEREIRENQFAT